MAFIRGMTMHKPDGTTVKVYDLTNYNNLIKAGYSDTKKTDNTVKQTIPTGTANREQVKDAYISYIGREPKESEYIHHIGKTGLDDLNEWAMKQKKEGTLTVSSTPTETTVEASTIQKPYIRHPNGIDVYDRQGKIITEANAAAIPGFWEKVEVTETAPNTNTGAQGATTTDTTTVTDETVGTDTTINTDETISNTGYDALTDNQLWSYWQELRENTEGGGMGPVLTQLIEKVNKEDPEKFLPYFDANGKGIVGTPWEGFSTQTWAMLWGWKEYPELIMYKPENVVRSTYRFPFRGEDPLAEGTFDEGAVSWINAIRNGEITNTNSLLGRMKLDSGDEWSSLPDSEKTALTVDAYIPPEGLSDIPKFGDFFQEEAEKKKIEDWVNEVYDKQLSTFLTDKEIEESRTIADWQTLTGDLSEDETRDLTDSQRRFRESLKQATEGYASAGLTHSSLREAGEGSLREGLELEKKGITTEKQRKQDLATKTKTRTLEDVAREKAAEQERIRVAKIEEKTGRLTQKRGEELVKYQALKDKTITPEEAGIKGV